MRGYTIFSGSANIQFANKVAQRLDCKLSDAGVKRFSDGEISVQIGESVRGKDVFIIQSTCAPANDNLMELLILTDALKRSSANSITAVIPYFGYARQDRKAAPRVPISAKLIADLMQTAGISRVATIDLHAGQIQGFFNIPVDNLYGSIIFNEHLKQRDLSKAVVASPDTGGIVRARAVAKALDLELVIVDKRREKANESEVMNVIGDVNGKDVIIVDDMIDTAGTIVKAAEVFKKLGAKSVIACCTHPVLSGAAYDRIENGALDELIVTDTIPLAKECKKITVLSVAPLFGEVIRRVYHNESVNGLFS
ncbi:ribose-phosphate pyrophosphokinase [Campylobacter sp. RM12651]|uniref:ribose-phosphate pyrophosphokinase n=1 Tax=Campylobacter sp. RM12651 TaxID=1660079 RepID=UPI001EFBC341|nr:ribose-phosphate pyrophosphokinase [Campylobacter sp. RM12651]ULO03366.1 ribose-phosphate diphosphokinase [Campylobacter sp. RM12651]